MAFTRLLVVPILLCGLPGLTRAQDPHLTGDFNSWSTASGPAPLPMLDDGVPPDPVAADGIFTLEVSLNNPNPGTDWTVEYKVLPSGEFGADELGVFNPSGSPYNFRLWFPGTVSNQVVTFTFDSRDRTAAGWTPGAHFTDSSTIQANHDGTARTWVAAGSFQGSLGDTDWNPASLITVMHDDGLGGDEVPGDGVLTFRFSAPADTWFAEWKVVNGQADFVGSTKLCPEGWAIDGIGPGDLTGALFSAPAGTTVTLEFDSIGGRMRTRLAGPLIPLLLSRVAVMPEEGEFIEIHNANPVPVNLERYFLSDRADYHNVVTGSRSDGTDFIAKFPSGASIPAHSTIVVALSAPGYQLTYESTPNFEVSETGTVPRMVEAYSGAIGTIAALGNGTETVTLFSWDGNSDLVVDSDYVFWGTPSAVDPAVDKTGVAVDGPDPGTETSSYQPDTPASSQTGPAAPASGLAIVRLDFDEGTEGCCGGNGSWGHDETSENLDVTWGLDVANPCPSGEAYCAGSCIDILSDDTNCGGCVLTCGAGLACCGGACNDFQFDDGNCGFCGNPCGAQTSCCYAACIDTWSDEFNCGGCEVTCGPGEGCCQGGCNDYQGDAANCGSCGNACDPGASCCGGLCIDTSSDEAHCGGCGLACDPGESCCDGSCVDPLVDPDHCGGCGDACGQGEDCCGGFCRDLASNPSHCGTCNLACAAGENCCSGDCSDPLTDPLHCGSCGVMCGAGEDCQEGICCATAEVNCSGVCADLQSDPQHCGDCATACDPGDVCSQGSCLEQCETGLTDCDGSCVDLLTDPAHCGICHQACEFEHAEGICEDGQCRIGGCDPLWGNCNGNPIDGCEKNLSSDVHACGSCDNACSFPQAVPVCVGGACQLSSCVEGFEDCDSNPVTGCEADLASASNCGSCGNLCSYQNAIALCDLGTCRMGNCDTGWGDCNAGDVDGCETDLRDDATNCGQCDRTCAAEEVCVAGDCASECPDGLTRCTSSCVDTTSNPAHCGGCGVACSPGEICRGGKCETPTYLVTGVVRNEETLEGLSGVIVRLDDGTQTVSTPDGTYALREVEAGTYGITAEAAGFETLTTEITVADSDLDQDLLLKPLAEAGCSCGSSRGFPGPIALFLLLVGLRRRRGAGDPPGDRA